EIAVQCDHIGFRKEFGDAAPPDRICRWISLKDVVCQYLHFECRREFANPAADTPEADNADRAARQFRQWPPPEAPFIHAGPLALEYEFAVELRLAVEIEEQRKHILCDGVGAVYRDVGDGDVPRPGRFDVDDVEARRKDTDEFQLRQPVQSFS